MFGAGAVAVGDTASAQSLRLTWGKATGQANWEKMAIQSQGGVDSIWVRGKEADFCFRCNDKSLGKNDVDRLVF